MTTWSALSKVSIVLAAGAFALLDPVHAHGEFYRFTDQTGRVRISNIPPGAFRADGSLEPADNPGSVVYQHRRVIERLRPSGDPAAAPPPVPAPTTEEAIESFENLIEIGRRIAR